MCIYSFLWTRLKLEVHRGSGRRQRGRGTSHYKEEYSLHEVDMGIIKLAVSIVPCSGLHFYRGIQYPIIEI